MEDFYAHIDDYMNGSMESEALKQFEAELGKNASLRKAVENYDTAKGIGEALLEVDMMETLTRLKDEYEIKKNRRVGTGELDQAIKINKLERKVRSFRKWISAAAFIGVILFVGWWVMEWNEEPWENEYILENIEMPYDDENEKSIEFDTIGKTSFQIGKNRFMRNMYEESISWFEKHISKTNDAELLSKGHYWLGAAYFRLRNLDKAIEEWEKSEEEEAKYNLDLITSTR